MKAPVKLNQAFWPRALTRFLPSAADPRALCGPTRDPVEFTRAVSALKFGATFKTTQKKRFPMTIQALASIRFENPPVILDVGASDASTSLDVMDAIPFRTYFVTDLHLVVFHRRHDAATWFYDAHGGCILLGTDRWIVYPDTRGAIFPFGWIAGRCFRAPPPSPAPEGKVELLNPLLRNRESGAVRVERYDVLEAWPHEKADLAIAANILNRSYFSDSQISSALRNLMIALREGGRLAVVDNRDMEKATIFRFAGEAATVEARVGPGTEIEGLALETFSAGPRQAGARSVGDPK